MIHSTGIYVFEIKHYKGIIYGNVNDNKWTQFFRTQDNNTFQNPFSQNAYHLRALKELIPNTDLYSVVVFTNEDCELKVENDNNELILMYFLHHHDDFFRNHGLHIRLHRSDRRGCCCRRAGMH